MKFQLLTFDSAKDPWFLDAKKEFLEKINHLLPLESVVLKSKKISRDTKELKLASERDSFFQYLKPNDALIVFDERAQDLDTMKFKEKFESYFQKSHFQRVLFLVGGAYGVDPQVKQRAQELWKVSSLTMNHLVVQIVILEQIYRSLMIIKNRNYHNE